MKDEEKVIETFEQVMKRMLAHLSPEERLAGLAPEQVMRSYAPEERLAGLAPEQRLAGLTDAQAVLALSDTMLRALSDEYLATLPEATRAAIRSRIGRG
jgi:hypothetical protein